MVIEIKSLYKKKIKKDKFTKFIIILAHTLETIFNSLMPFIYGFYFVQMKNIIFLFAFLLHLVFYFKINHHGEDFEIFFIRRFR